MGILTEKTVSMDANDWLELAAQAKRTAVQAIHDEGPSLIGGQRLLNAAKFLHAAQVFTAHANMMEMGLGGHDTAQVDVWDLSDEEQPA